MPSLKRLLPALCAITLVALSVLGCTQNRLAQGNDVVQSVDCRSCHSPGGAAGAEDFSSIYANSKSHHSVGVKYPLGLKAGSDFNPPNGQGVGVTFFDRNGNGQPDIDEVLLFGAKSESQVECSSCHRPHGDSQRSGNNSVGLYYLRVDNVNSALCVTCHKN